MYDPSFKLDILRGVYNDMSGRLFSRVREQNNLCYRIYFGIEPLSCGAFVWYVSLGLEKDKIN